MRKQYERIVMLFLKFKRKREVTSMEESIKEKDNSPDLKISVMPNLQMEVPSAATDKQLPLEQFEDKPVVYFDKAMM